MRFPPGFLWGAATASYQIEGGAKDGGRGPSIWDTFCAEPGKIHGGANGDVACDHFNRYPEDVALMADLGLPAYRFSVSWSRVMPDGKRVSQEGLDFYRRLVDELTAKGVEPVVTLYHWDLPQALEDEGGWRNRELAGHFAEYAQTVHSALGDRVRQWTTINEPFCSAFLGYFAGIHAPGDTDPAAALVAAHHLLLAHGTALQALRAQARPEHSFSVALNFSPALAEGYGPEHVDAARKFDGMHNRFFLDPLLGKGYPEDVLADLAHVGGLADAIKDGDLETIAGPIDWLGVNYYAPTRVKPLEDPYQQSNCPLPGLRGVDVVAPRPPLTGFGWEQTPSSLTELLRWLNWHTGGLPLVIAENGAAFEDVIGEDGRIRDTARTNYIADHLRAVHAAIEGGADVRGYLLWALLDNFEWSMGYSQRFGIVHVDFETQRRTVKDSARFYQNVITHNALSAAGPAEPLATAATDQ
ncbi:GH1 family beta-glucosidase [Amycolatopsis pithecellobii]|uniref:Beta-glucosidase n=1 Tax=Amycolatopsis pithecellobii TaxID=664692 RepID=A0A6N7Z5A7_9PSEU|nr:beta-glucosidase [Amycolatopsis pithecellobii]